MKFCFIGDIEYQLTDMTNPETPADFGCTRGSWNLYEAHLKDLDKIKKGVKKYKDKLLKLSVDPTDVDTTKLKNMSLREFLTKWNVSKNAAITAFNILYVYCMGMEILTCVEQNGECHFHLPA